MRPRPRVLRLERAREGRHCLHVGVLQQLALASLDLKEVTEIARVQQQLLLRPVAAFRRRAERDAVQTAGKPVRDGQELERTERLAYERVGPGTLGGGAL